MAYDKYSVKKAYEKIAQEEDKQEKGKSLRVQIPREFIKKYIDKNDIVLDAGGGTGYNSILMAKISKHVTLLDISPKILEVAKQNVREQKLENKINLCQGDISNLEKFSDGQFTFVVCVGDSISYVLEKRFDAMKELTRVAKSGAFLVIGCDSKYGFMRQYLKKGNLKEVTRINKNHETYCGMGPRTYVYTVDEMKQLLNMYGCDVLEVASTPTLTDTVDRSQFYEEEKWDKLKKLEMELCRRPELLGIGNHLLFVAKKR
ncbi:MAG: class I SAM-dependent methyltransferase [Nanobdellota archaeon]